MVKEFAITSSSKIYGRRLGRPLSTAREKALKRLLPEIHLPQNLQEKHEVAPSVCFPVKADQVTLEIGFGNGEHLLRLIDNRRENEVFLGAEPYINGMSAFLKDLEDTASNSRDCVRVWMDDALVLVRSLQACSVDRIFILNPDPWPKTRHHKRRIINWAHLDQLATILKPGGQLILTTDVDDLAEWMLIHSYTHPAFVWEADAAKDWMSLPLDWHQTRYETKGALVGHQQTYLFFRKCV